VRDVMRQEDVSVPVIAKLEKPEAVENLEAIVEAFDGIMVARGDLGVELALEQVPLVQKRAVQAARERNKPVIVATQMLESMITNSRPTRAEASDVANAVLDGADAVMLSGETSVGRYPIAAVRTMERIIDTVESDAVRVPDLVRRSRSRSGAIVRSARDIAESLDVKALATFTQTGGSARRLAALHPRMPLLAFTVDARVRSQLALSWGVETFLVPEVQHTDDMVRQVDFSLLSIGRLKEGDRVVVVAGSPPNTPGSTNLIRVHEVGTDS
jgi:pyruvate kinase